MKKTNNYDSIIKNAQYLSMIIEINCIENNCISKKKIKEAKKEFIFNSKNLFKNMNKKEIKLYIAVVLNTNINKNIIESKEKNYTLKKQKN